MILDSITPLLLTYNEAPNLVRTLAPLAWAREIMVVDSGSTDETVALARSFPNVRLVVRPFDNHTAQWNFGLDQCRTDWVLSLDADYVLPPAFPGELRSLTTDETVSAYFSRFRYCILGRPLRGTLYPPRAVLFRRDRCRYVPDGHTQMLHIKGQTAFLETRIDHDDRKPLSHWLWAQDRYARLEAAKLAAAAVEGLSLPDKLRRQRILAPLIVFVYTLLVKGLIWDGWAGWYYVFQRTLAEIILSLRLLEATLQKDARP